MRRCPTLDAITMPIVVKPDQRQRGQRRLLELRGPNVPHHPVRQPQHLHQAAGSEEQREHADDERGQPFEPRQRRRAGHRLGDEAADAGLTRQGPGVLLGRVGRVADAHDDHEHVGHQEQEDSKGQCAGDDRTTGRRVVLVRTKRDVDPSGTRPGRLETPTRVVDGTGRPCLSFVRPGTGAFDPADRDDARCRRRRARRCARGA